MKVAPRDVFRHRDLRALLAPASIAIVGASPNASNFAGRTLANLAGFEGEVYRVNPRYDAIDGVRCWPGVAALPEVPDCVIVAVAREGVHAVVDECAAIGVGAVIVYASGYAETGKSDRAAQQTHLSRLAADRRLRILGPNCIGIVNVASGARMTFSATPDFDPPLPHAIGLVSQSGAIGFSLAQAAAQGVSFSHLLTSGNSCDVDVADLVAALAEDPACKVIACVFEGLREPRRLLQAAQLAWDLGKPLVVYKLATGEQGAASAMSHTGSLAGESAVYRAALQRLGAVWVDRFDDLLPTASFLAKAGRPLADGVAVLATSGGASIMAADAGEALGVPLPQPSPQVQALLAARIPEYGSARNPCDVTAQMLNDGDSLSTCAGALLGDPAFGTLLHPAPWASTQLPVRLTDLGALGRQAGKPVCIVWLTRWLEGPGCAEAQRDPHLALFHSMESCFTALAAWLANARRRQSPPGGSPHTYDIDFEKAAASVASMLREAASEVLTEREGKAVLAHYGIPVVQEHLACDADEAVRHAQALGLPAVLKIESPDIAHKTEVDGVVVGLRSLDDVRIAHGRILASIRAHAPAAKVHGVLVQPMIPSGLELMVGARRDPDFGPLVMVGFGGTLVELLRDTAMALAPLRHDEALTLLDSLRGAALLNGFRGAPRIDRAALSDIVVRVAQLLLDHPVIEEIDINPLICHATNIVAVDALIRRR